MKKESIYLSVAVAGTLLTGVLAAVLLKRDKSKDVIMLEDDVFFSHIKDEVLTHVRWCDRTVKDISLIPHTTREIDDVQFFEVVADTSEIFTIAYYLDTCDIGVMPKEYSKY